MRKKAAGLCMILGLSMITTPAYAQDPPYSLPEEKTVQITHGNSYEVVKLDSGEIQAIMSLTVDEAVAFGLEHNKDLESLSNQLLLANIKLSNAKDNGTDLKQAKSDLNNAGRLLETKEEALLTGKEDLRTAWEVFEQGLAPSDIPYLDDQGNLVMEGPDTPVIVVAEGEAIEDSVRAFVQAQGEDQVVATITATVAMIIQEAEKSILQLQAIDPVSAAAAKTALESYTAPMDLNIDQLGITITAGSNIKDAVTVAVMTEAAKVDIEAIVEEKVALIRAGIISELKSKQTEIDEGEIAIAEAEATLMAKWAEYEGVINDASREMENLIGYSSTITLEAEDAKKMMIQMASVNLSLTDYAQDIYRNQIAMLIRKNYYDALLAEKMLDVKSKAAQRGETQFNMVKLSYETGMKAKDDYLLAKMYYDGTLIEKRLAEASYQNAMYELKKTMNLNMGYKLLLEDSLDVEVTEIDLDRAIEKGLLGRIEIQQSLGEKMICELNEEIIDDMSRSAKKAYQETEADILLDQAAVKLEKNKTMVAAQIHQSYELTMATGDMLKQAESLIGDAREVVEIANLKYEQGFGMDNALMKGLNLEGSSDTILGVIAAQEKLTEVEAQVANIRYSYIMAKCKFYNDAAMLKD